MIIASYHGIPKKYFEKGDPYHCYCHKTTRLIKEKFNKVEIQLTFQSRFGPQEWLTPYTDKTLESLPSKGIKNLLVICPGFASDCVETLEEINIQGRESFLLSFNKISINSFCNISFRHNNLASQNSILALNINIYNSKKNLQK